MKPDLSEKYILITGAGRGLGRSTALHLAGCGAVLGVADIDAGSAEETAKLIQEAGGQAYAYGGDMSAQQAFLDVADNFAAKGGRLDAVINNAMLLHYCPVDQVDEDKLTRMLDIGVKAPFWAAQALLKHYDEARGAAMINYSSPVAHRGYPNTSAYSAAKGAVTVLTKVLGAELGPRGIRVNAVSPASVPTPGALGMVSKEEYERRSATIPMRRIGTEEDNYNAVAFLLSEEASFINGEILNVDGGASSAA